MAVLVCSNCDDRNPDGYRFCGRCGAALPVAACPSCGSGNPAGQPFCGQCGWVLDGASLGSEDPALEERKLATVLFADVVGFTSLSERTDPEVVARMVDGAFRKLGEIVTEHGGTVDKFMGDSVMAVFGVPSAHDDDAERAVAAGLAMREVVGDLAFSIGINSGEVMATTVGREGDVTVIGDTVNVAARLEQAAAPGQVLCGRLTAELARDRVRFSEGRRVLLKGKRESVEVWEAEALRPVGTGSERQAPTLVGRDDELAFLKAQWHRVRRDHQPRVVLLCGEAGSGKTRLADELAVVAHGDEGLVVRSAYPAYGTLGGAAVARDVVRQLGPGDDPEVSARIRSVGGEVDRSLQGIDPAALAQEQLWAFGRLLQEKSADAPVLIVIDDMHRSGFRTLEVLGELTGRLGEAAALIVLAGRSDPPEWLLQFPSATTVRLAPLGRADATTLAAAFTCDLPLAPTASDVLVDRANGNPLYLRELLAVVLARGLLVADGEYYHLTADAPIPATLQALLAARLDALEPSQKLVLQHVAVLGHAATADQVAALSTPQAVGSLRTLVDAGLLRRSGDGHYDLADPLLTEVAYETLPHLTRGDLHRRAGDLVTGPEERARHLDRASTYLADDPIVASLAADALVDAAEELTRASRHPDAVRLLHRAVALGLRRPGVLLELARLEALCGALDDLAGTLALLPDDPDDPALGVERDHIAAAARIFVDPAWARGRLDEVAERWRDLGVGEKEAWARANAGVASFYLSEMEESAARLEHALGLFESLGDRPGAIAASSFLCLAKPTDRRVSGWLADALEFADAAGDRTRQIATLSTLTWNHFFRSLCGGPSDMVEAEGFALRLASLAEELGAGEMTVHSLGLLAIMARLTGRIDEAADHIAALERSPGSPREKDSWLGWAAGFSVLVAAGQPDAAPPSPPLSTTDPVVGMAVVVIETALTLAGRSDEALSRIGAARGHSLGVIGDLTGCLHGLALVLAGRYDEARPLAERAAAAARSLSAAPVERAAAALLAEISGDTTALRAPHGVGGLADALVLRALAVNGDRQAAQDLRRASADLVMPGLLSGL